MQMSGKQKAHIALMYFGLVAAAVLLALSWAENTQLARALAQLEAKTALQKSSHVAKAMPAPQMSARSGPTEEEIAATIAAAVSKTVMRSVPVESIFPEEKTVIPGLMELLKDPEFSAAFGQKLKSRVDIDYVAFFQAMNLDRATREQLRQLLAEKPVSLYEAATIGREGGTEGVMAGLDIGGEKIDAKIYALLGPEGYDKLQYYNETLGVRRGINGIARRLAYTDEPLSARQINGLIDTIYAATPERASRRQMGYLNAGYSETISVEQMQNAGSVLSESQLATLVEELRQNEMMNRYEQEHYAALKELGGIGKAPSGP